MASTLLKKKPLVVCGPSGSGKSTLTKYLLKKYDHAFKFSVSSTTRAPRTGEIHGVDYFFMSHSQFEEVRYLIMLHKTTGNQSEEIH